MAARFKGPGGWPALLSVPIGFGVAGAIVCRGRALYGSLIEQVWHCHAVTTVALISIPLACLVGIGCFDYWFRWASGAPTIPEDHSGHGARSWRDYFRVNTDHKVIGLQYICTTFFFFVAGGVMAML